MGIPVRNSGAPANERIMGAVLVLLFALGIASQAQAQAAPAAQVSGAEVYGKYCASCHDQVGARIPTHEALTKMSQSRILRTLDFGLMMSSFDIKPGNYMVRLVVRDSEGDPNAPGMDAPVTVASAGLTSLGDAAADFGARSVLLAIRSLAKNLRSIPGRKMVVLFSGGFPLTMENQSELTATIDACNKSNVAVYALDARGLTTRVPGGSALNGRSS